MTISKKRFFILVLNIWSFAATVELEASVFSRAKKIELSPLQDLEKLINDVPMSNGLGWSLMVPAIVCPLSFGYAIFNMNDEKAQAVDLMRSCLPLSIVGNGLVILVCQWMSAKKAHAFETRADTKANFLAKKLRTSSKAECFEIINFLSSFNLKTNIGQTSVQTCTGLALTKVFAAAKARLQELEREPKAA
jgi:hypothetical protein